MSWSVSEVRALAKKAARGKGYTWGEAEEAAQAVGWLEQRNIPGTSALALCLEQCSGVGTCSSPADPHWSLSGVSSAGITPIPPTASAVTAACCCPLKTGMALMDAADPAALWHGDNIQRDAVEPRQMRAPLLLLPFLAAVTASGNGSLQAPAGLHVHISTQERDWSLWIGAGECLDANHSAAHRQEHARSWQTLSTTPVAMCLLTREAEPGNPLSPASAEATARSARVPDARAEAITVLEKWAANTYAPATEASRQAGAGAGLTDND